VFLLLPLLLQLLLLLKQSAGSTLNTQAQLPRQRHLQTHTVTEYSLAALPPWRSAALPAARGHCLSHQPPQKQPVYLLAASSLQLPPLRHCRHQCRCSWHHRCQHCCQRCLVLLLARHRPAHHLLVAADLSSLLWWPAPVMMYSDSGSSSSSSSSSESVCGVFSGQAVWC
jgi:hypothetical protein